MRKLRVLVFVACLAASIASWPEAGRAEAPNRRESIRLLDADGNGLYDGRERKALLEVLQKACPELKGPFDADGDGEVTVQEQTAGRHPLAMLVSESSLGDMGRIPWAIDIFPEWITTAYLQEDVRPGPVAEHRARGTIPALARPPTSGLQPRKARASNGIEFAGNSGQHLSTPGGRDARWNCRWCVFTFRINADSGTDEETVLLDLNRGNTSGESSPRIWFSKSTGLRVQYVGLNREGLDRRVMTARNVLADGRSWNVLVCGIRYGRMFASVNGVPLAARALQPPRFSSARPRGTLSYLGDESKGNMAWAYDSLIFGLTEPSEAMVRKMTGWAAHRLGFQDRLPADHPYRTARPVLDAEDFPGRYVHDSEKWAAWGASLNKQATRVNAGGPRVEPRGFERVFYDDFRADRVRAGTSGEGDLWTGPGFNTAVGVDAPLLTPGEKPDAYPHGAADRKQTLSLVRQGDRWRGSGFYSVNDLGYGYTWKGPKIFRIRCMFPNVAPEKLVGGLFPAFWSYDPDFLFWRTANRIEVDWFEFDGRNGFWLNALSSHCHGVHVPNSFVKNPGRHRSYKVYGGELTEEKSGIPGGLWVWDGRFHTWEFVVNDRWTFVNVTVTDDDGRERWVEVCRCPTAPTYLERLDLQLDYALKARHGTPESGARQDFVVDWIEVLQKPRDIDSVPRPFTARPRLSGSPAAGGTMVCEPNVEGIRDVRYYWFADGYPLTYGPDNAFTLTAAEAGREIRCMVKAVGARDMPEAWSNTVE
jgi:hypothetical protein